MLFRRPVILLLVFLFANFAVGAEPSFVSVKGAQFITDGKAYYFVGTNYWYGTVLGLEKDKKRGVERLRRELDFLKANGVTNLRLLGGAEGSGMINGVIRVGPALQPEQGKFDMDVLGGLDLVLAEMGKRKMKAVIFISNNWEWSGGFQQYLIWNGLVPKDQETANLHGTNSGISFQSFTDVLAAKRATTSIWTCYSAERTRSQIESTLTTRRSWRGN